MKALVQRVSEARVRVGSRLIGAIGPGLLVFLGVDQGDARQEAEWLAGKIARLRIFEDAAGRMNRAVTDIDGAALVVSQFTLCADLRRGNRPGFSQAAPPDLAERLYREFCSCLAESGVSVETGEFAARMAVELVNDGPVTLWLDSRELMKA